MRRFSFATVFIAAFVFMPFCTAQATQPKRPMTFEDMMKMKRLGETAVSPDGKWLAYSVTTVDLNQNTKTAELWVQAIAPSSGTGSDPQRMAVAQPGDGGPQFAPLGNRILFLSGREGGQQVWLFGSGPAAGGAGQGEKQTDHFFIAEKEAVV